MLPAPRVIIIDDNPAHLRGLAEGLNLHGAACLQIHFSGDASAIRPCPHVRVLFADLHLTESGAATDNARHFTVLGGLLEQHIAPTGPYALVLWTRYPDQAEALKRFLDQRLSGIPRPLCVTALDKGRFLAPDGTVADPAALVAEISKIVQQQPPAAALFDWEENVLSAAAETVGALIDVAGGTRAGMSQDQQLARLLRRLAVESVGKGHVEKNRFHAVNEALLPILADRVAYLKGQRGTEDLWQAAFEGTTGEEELTKEEVARLNRLLHIADAADHERATERGAVIALPASMSGDNFEKTFGLSQADAAQKQFSAQGFAPTDPKFRWVLLQLQAICDFAQGRPGPLPVALGLEMPCDAASQEKGNAALYMCPVFEAKAEARALHFSARFQVSVSPSEAAGVHPLYRIREPLLNMISYAFHGYGARPGIISFRFKADKQKAIPAKQSGKKS